MYRKRDCNTEAKRTHLLIICIGIVNLLPFLFANLFKIRRELGMKKSKGDSTFSNSQRGIDKPSLFYKPLNPTKASIKPPFVYQMLQKISNNLADLKKKIKLKSDIDHGNRNNFVVVSKNHETSLIIAIQDRNKALKQFQQQFDLDFDIFYTSNIKMTHSFSSQFFNQQLTYYVFFPHLANSVNTHYRLFCI